MRFIFEMLVFLAVLLTIVCAATWLTDFVATDRREALKRPLKTNLILCNDGYCVSEQCEGSVADVYYCLEHLDD